MSISKRLHDSPPSNRISRNMMSSTKGFHSSSIDPIEPGSIRAWDPKDSVRGLMIRGEAIRRRLCEHCDRTVDTGPKGAEKKPNRRRWPVCRTHASAARALTPRPTDQQCADRLQ
jgi:hypothetical protein